MTCKEVREITSKPYSFTNSTRALRAVILRHFDLCSDCGKWIDGYAELTDEAKIRKYDNITLHDLEDPEYLEVRYKGVK